MIQVGRTRPTSLTLLAAELPERIDGAIGAVDEIAVVDGDAGEFAVDAVPAGGRLAVSGWAADEMNRGVGSGVVVAIGDTLIDATYFAPREDVAAVHGEAYRRSGFHAIVPVDGSAGEALTIRVFVIDRGATHRSPLGAPITLPIVNARLDAATAERTTRSSEPFVIDAISIDDETIDATAISVSRGARLQIRGWALDIDAGAPGQGVYALVDDDQVVRAATVRRTDVAEVRGDERLARCGFEVAIDTRGFLSGAHDLRLALVAADGRSCYVSDPLVRVDID